ncbi:MAG: acyl-CoA thioesterase II [Henriciella sp.]|uniref:acyl-CoA thioesterase n=1 Tax=Henriciella sp. TaxID=1968823 RepID=UPI00260D0710|nr:acyl-CoA thioesterase II [Henriciella sp.]
MTDAVSELLSLLELERLEVDLFRGITPENEAERERVYGGQVIAQALAAAYRTVDEDRACHSLHAYFIRPGDPKRPIIFEVDRSRDGGSFTTRRVVAIQHGQQILNMSASFHVHEDGWDHQHKMPETKQPEELKSHEDFREMFKDRIPEDMRKHWDRPRPFEMKEISGINPFDPKPKSDVNQVWFRTTREIDVPPAMHHCMIAWASDMNLLGSSLRPHGLHWMNPKLMTASLDHTIWFHAPIRADQWLLYAMDSPKAGNGRSFNRGSIFTREGKLVASTAQEGLMRKLTKKK